MSKPFAADCANLVEQLLLEPRIPYVLGGEKLDHRGIDCQGLIEAIVRKLGGSMSYRGSNDMFRNACSYLAPLKQARSEYRLVPGAVLFIVRQDGKEPKHYKDKLGNASHVGWFTGGTHEVVHASSSKGAVVRSTLKNGWTHLGWLKAVDYSNTEEESFMSETSILTLGARGEHVQHLQERLMRLDYDVGIRTGADGIYGKATKAAVEQFQQDHALPVTGDWGHNDELTLLARFIQVESAPATSSPAERIRSLAKELLLIADQMTA